jgi:hypothetical protein
MEEEKRGKAEKERKRDNPSTGSGQAVYRCVGENLETWNVDLGT